MTVHHGKETVLMRCQHCSAINRIAKNKFLNHPICGKCHNVIKIYNEPINISSETFNHVVLKSPGYVLVEYWSQTCGYCLALNPLLDQVARAAAGELIVAKVNIQFEGKLAAQADLRGVPTLHLYKNGKKINEITGGLTGQQLQEWLHTSIK